MATPSVLVAQSDTFSAISLKECIEVALENNYSIKIAKNDLEIAQNNLNYAPFLPTVSIGATSRHYFIDRNDIDAAGNVIPSSSTDNDYAANANLSWTLFDGMKMFATREKQRVLLSQGEFSFRNTLQELVGDILSQYYMIVKMQSEEKVLKELLKVSKLREEQAFTRYEIGQDSGLEYKQAKIYLNNDSTKLLVHQENLRNAYTDLYTLVNLPLDSKTIVKDTIIKEPLMDMENIRERMFANNLSLLRVKAGERISELELKRVRSERFPTLSFSTSYSYGYSSNNHFPSRYDNISNLNGGLTLSFPIFQGGEVNRKVRNSKLELENAKLNYLQAQQIMESQLIKQFNSYLSNVRLIDFENESTEVALLNLDAAMEKYRLGALSGIEFREIQTTYLNAYMSMLNVQYKVKLSEIELHILAGDLFKEE